MPSPENFGNLVFWILVGVVLIVGLFVWGFVKVVSLLAAKKEPGHHPQVSGHQGTNFHDASSHDSRTTHLTNNGAINIGVPKIRGPSDSGFGTG